MTTRGLVAFIDTGAAAGNQAEALASLGRGDALGEVVSRAFVVTPEPTGVTLPRGWEAVPGASSVQVCQWAFDAAAQSDLALLAVTGDVRPTREAVGALMEALTLDPLFGVAIPRVGAGTDGRVLTAPRWDDQVVPIPLRVLAYEPEYHILADAVAPVMLFRHELVGSLPLEVGDWNGPVGLLAAYTMRARRAGFRAVLCNRVVALAGSDTCRHQLERKDRRGLRRVFPELGRVNAALTGPEPRHGEEAMAAAFDAPDSLLLDARNLGCVFNGTSAAILGMSDALYRARRDRGVTFWVHEEAARWHGLAARYPSWRVHPTSPALPAAHAAAIRLSQPWYISELDSMSRAAAVNVYWMLDTISWDILYTAPEGLDAVWTRLASEADAILFISDFSRQRFLNRFGAAPGVRTGVCHLSLAPADYVGGGAADSPAGPYWLVVGNRYDHKHIGPTVDLLTRSFPRQRLVVFGDREQVRTDLVTRFDSGSIDDTTVRACFAGAELVVFPSFYEGFGLPMVQGLAHGHTVVARASSLVDELAALYQGPGRLLTYRTDRELVELLIVLSRGGVVDGVNLGTHVSAGPWTWDSAAASMLQLVGALLAECPSGRMLTRTGLSAHGLRHPLRRATQPGLDPRAGSLA